MPFEDEFFDAVVSTFGRPFTSDAEAAITEVARVCRRGGRLAITSWARGGANAVEEAVLARYLDDD